MAELFDDSGAGDFSRRWRLNITATPFCGVEVLRRNFGRLGESLFLPQKLRNFDSLRGLLGGDAPAVAVATAVAVVVVLIVEVVVVAAVLSLARLPVTPSGFSTLLLFALYGLGFLQETCLPLEHAASRVARPSSPTIAGSLEEACAETCVAGGVKGEVIGSLTPVAATTSA